MSEGDDGAKEVIRRAQELWDLLICGACSHQWPEPDRDESWTDVPEAEVSIRCPNCDSNQVVREERG